MRIAATEKDFRTGLSWIAQGLLKMHGFTIEDSTRQIIKEAIGPGAKTLYLHFQKVRATMNETAALSLLEEEFGDAALQTALATLWVIDQLPDNEQITLEEVQHIVHEKLADLEIQRINEDFVKGFRRLYPKASSQDRW